MTIVRQAAQTPSDKGRLFRRFRKGSSGRAFLWAVFLTGSLLSAPETARAQNLAPSAPAPAAVAPEAMGTAAEGAPLIFLRWRGQEPDIAAVIPERTPVTVRLKRALSSGDARKGDAVEFEVAGDVRDAGGRTVLIPSGTPAFGNVAEARRAGAFGRAGEVRVTCDYVQFPEDRRVPLRPLQDLAAAGRSRRTASTVSTVAVGLPVWGVTHAIANFFGDNKNGFVGEVVPLGAGILSGFLAGSFWRGGNVSLAAGTTFTAEVSRETPLPAAAPSTPAVPVPSPVGN